MTQINKLSARLDLLVGLTK